VKKNDWYARLCVQRQVFEENLQLTGIKNAILLFKYRVFYVFKAYQRAIITCPIQYLEADY